MQFEFVSTDYFNMCMQLTKVPHLKIRNTFLSKTSFTSYVYVIFLTAPRVEQTLQSGNCDCTCYDQSQMLIGSRIRTKLIFNSKVSCDRKQRSDTFALSILHNPGPSLPPVYPGSSKTSKKVWESSDLKESVGQLGLELAAGSCLRT